MMPGMEDISFHTTEAVFDFIDKNIGSDKLVLVIDELPYWADKDEALLSIIQKYIDTTWKDKNLKIILCGSALSFMEKKVLSEKSPLLEEEQTVLYSLDKLINVGLVEKKKCITDEKNKKKTQCVLKDYMFKFWYEFISKGTSVIEMGQGELYYQRAVKPVLHSFMETVFEEMCRYYTLKRE